MRNLALVFLWEELNPNQEPPNNLETWFKQERLKNPSQFFPFLIEPAEKVERFYVLKASEKDKDLAILEPARETKSLGDKAAIKLPFNMPSGSQSPALGPVIKRTFSKDKGSGPSEKIIKTTLDYFRELSNEDTSWATYFAEIVETFHRKKLQLNDKIKEGETAFYLAIHEIDEKKTVYLTFQDSQGRLPGDIAEYIIYLQNILASTKYSTLKTPPKVLSKCPICQASNTVCYSSALSGAGINIANIDRDGAFPGISQENAHLGFAICLDCADLLYIFKFHVMENFKTYIGGYQALLLPKLNLNGMDLLDINQIFKDYSQDINNNKGLFKENLMLRILVEQKAITTIDIIWASFGQKFEELRGVVSDVMPSRLKQINDINTDFLKILDFKINPKHWFEDQISFDLQLSFLANFLKRPGGDKAKKINKSPKLFELKRQLVESIYKKQQINLKRFWDEVFVTMEWYFVNTLLSDNPAYECTQEGYSEKKNKIWLTMAGWIRHLAVFLIYLNKMEVLKKMPNQRTYNPNDERLKPYFAENSGINTNEKAYAFILGILYGRVLTIQGAKGVNVSANALTWLKRLTISGKDLPELHIKIREKLLAYDAEGSELVRIIINELGNLGILLGDEIKLEQIPCCYFILLGQSVSTDYFDTKKTKEA